MSPCPLDLIGIFVFAISGALLAVRKNFDVFGIAVLAEVTALGGGLFRDLVIGAVPPAAFTDLGYFLTPLLAALLVFFLHPHVERIQTGVGAATSEVRSSAFKSVLVSGSECGWSVSCRAPRPWGRFSVGN